MNGTERLAALRDPALPAMRTMLGREARAMLSAATGDRSDVTSARPAQIHWDPGSALAVVYEARTSAAATAERLVAFTATELPARATVLERGDERVAVWPMSRDPWLPGLAVALDPVRARALLDGLGVPAGEVRPRVRSYRPGRRAVVELTVGRVRLFVKVVRPERAQALQARHAAMSDALPVPRSHGWSAEHGVVVLEALPGATLRETLSATHAQLPDPAALLSLLARIPSIRDGAVRRTDWAEQARGHARLLSLVMPDLRDRLDALLERCADDRKPGPLTPIHGDLHEAQLKVRDGRITGVLDVDTVCAGYRIDDWATLAGHLAVWGPAQPARVRERTRDHLAGLLRAAHQEVEKEALRRRVANVIVALATGPFRAQSAGWPAQVRSRIELAGRWAVPVALAA